MKRIITLVVLLTAVATMFVSFNAQNVACARRHFNFWQELREDFKRDSEREARYFARNVQRDYYRYLRRRIRDSYEGTYRRNGYGNQVTNVTNVTINVGGAQKVYSFSQRLSGRELECMALLAEYTQEVGIFEVPVDRNSTRSTIEKLCNSGVIPYKFLGSVRDISRQLVAVKVERLE